ncbi:MAG: extracellular solute-binding protein [Clostridiales Family XIII bacterium]|jgi:hypothetical protein|nr:extracellular solute-binding protein [Clostridiales Family XIII bacterium]
MKRKMGKRIGIKLLAALCVVALAFTAAACSDVGDKAASDGNASVDGKADMTGLPDKTLADKKVVIYSWMDFVPEKEFEWQSFRFIDYYGGEVEMIIGSGNYYEDLYKRVAAGEIPDIVIGEAKSFPAMIMRDLVQPWDEYLDYADPVWEKTGAKSDIEAMRWDGKIYNLTGKAHTLGVLFYNKRIIEESGLEEPATLQERGEWDWDAFKRYLDETTVDNDGDGTKDVYGLVNTGDFPLAFIATTGEIPIDFSDSFINNAKSDKVREAADFIYNLGENGSNTMSLSDPADAFSNGKAAFVYTNDYRGYEDYAQLWTTDGIGIVPMPAYPGGAEQWQAALPDNMWLMKGAKNPEGAALLMLAQQYDTLLNLDPSAGSVESTEINEWLTKGYTEDAAASLVSISSLPTKLLFSRNIELPDGDLEYLALSNPWTTLADAQSGVIDKAITDATTPISVDSGTIPE